MVEKNNNIGGLVVTGIGVFIALILIVTLFGAIVNVPPGSVGIMFDRMNGGVQSTPLYEGWKIALPFIQTIYIMDIRTVKTEYPASAASKDLQVVNSQVAVSYHVLPTAAPKVYKEIGGDFSDKMIAPAIQEQFKASTAKFDAQDLIQQREVVKNEVTDKLQTLLTKYGIKIDEVSVMNFQFSPEFEKAIEQKVTAQQNKLTAENILAIKEVEAKQRMAEATGTANSVLIQAIAEANATKVKGEAAAYSTQVQGEAQANVLALQRSQISNELVQYEYAKRWSGILPSFVMGSGANPLLMLNTGASVGTSITTPTPTPTVGSPSVGISSIGGSN
jgi:prohibitin 2